MLRFLADENFNNNLLRGMLRQNPQIDVVRVQDVGLLGADDPDILQWAAQEERILLTYDVATITHFAYERVKRGQSMPGVFEINRKVAIKNAIDDLLLIAECGLDGEWEGQVCYLPLR